MIPPIRILFLECKCQSLLVEYPNGIYSVPSTICEKHKKKYLSTKKDINK